MAVRTGKCQLTVVDVNEGKNGVGRSHIRWVVGIDTLADRPEDPGDGHASSRDEEEPSTANLVAEKGGTNGDGKVEKPMTEEHVKLVLEPGKGGGSLTVGYHYRGS
jgi:hypothetical protein